MQALRQDSRQHASRVKSIEEQMEMLRGTGNESKKEGGLKTAVGVDERLVNIEKRVS